MTMATELFVLCVKLASVEKILEERNCERLLCKCSA